MPRRPGGSTPSSCWHCCWGTWRSITARSSLGFLSVDDPDYVQNNPYIESLSAANLKHILTSPYTANYAPANLLSYALDVALAEARARLPSTSPTSSGTAS